MTRCLVDMTNVDANDMSRDTQWVQLTQAYLDASSMLYRQLCSRLWVDGAVKPSRLASGSLVRQSPLTAACVT